MHYFEHLTALPAPQGSSVALGYFDGLHIGHQTVVRRAVEKAAERGLAPALFTFRLPEASRIKGPRLLSTELKHQRAAGLGVELYMAPDFEEFRDFTPQEFVDRILVECYQAKEVFCGENFTFGSKKSGNVQILSRLCAQKGIGVTVLPLLQYKGRPVSSTRIRQALEEGDVPLANELLGAPYQIDFPVRHGKGLGHTLGFPTINQHYPEGFQTPREGVYITRTCVEGVWYPSATGYGTRPTVNGVLPTCETFLPGYEGSLYGQSPVVEFYRYLWPTRKFDNLQQLTDCVMSAAEQARRFFEAGGEEKA